jgi:hypothetical protein
METLAEGVGVALGKEAVGRGEGEDDSEGKKEGVAMPEAETQPLALDEVVVEALALGDCEIEGDWDCVSVASAEPLAMVEALGKGDALVEACSEALPGALPEPPAETLGEDEVAGEALPLGEGPEVALARGERESLALELSECEGVEELVIELAPDTEPEALSEGLPESDEMLEGDTEGTAVSVEETDSVELCDSDAVGLPLQWGEALCEPLKVLLTVTLLQAVAKALKEGDLLALGDCTPVALARTEAEELTLPEPE